MFTNPFKISVNDSVGMKVAETVGDIRYLVKGEPAIQRNRVETYEAEPVDRRVRIDVF